VLQNAIKEHEDHERKIIEYSQQTLRAEFNYQCEIETLENILEAIGFIYEQDKPHNYITDPNTETGQKLVIIRSEIEKWKKTNRDLLAKWNSEELSFKDFQEKEDRVLIRLNSIDDHIVQGIEAIQVKKQIDSTNDEDNHFLMQFFSSFYPSAYLAMKNGLAAGIIEYKDNLFNFKCHKGCVGLVFNEAGCNEYKQIIRFILINGKEAKYNTLKNNTSNTPPESWEKIRHIFLKK
jgi:hypothetical protein